MCQYTEHNSFSLLNSISIYFFWDKIKEKPFTTCFKTIEHLIWYEMSSKLICMVWCNWWQQFIDYIANIWILNVFIDAMEKQKLQIAYWFYFFSFFVHRIRYLKCYMNESKQKIISSFFENSVCNIISNMKIFNVLIFLFFFFCRIAMVKKKYYQLESIGSK